MELFKAIMKYTRIHLTIMCFRIRLLKNKNKNLLCGLFNKQLHIFQFTEASYSITLT